MGQQDTIGSRQIESLANNINYIILLTLCVNTYMYIYMNLYIIHMFVS